MIEKIKHWYYKKFVFPRPTGYIYHAENHKGWGNAINFSNFENGIGRGHGHLDRRPENGDFIQAKTDQNRRINFLVHNAEWCDDPSDMWFCDLVAYEPVIENQKGED